MINDSHVQQPNTGLKLAGIMTCWLSIILLSACASERPADPGNKNAKRKAAETNTSLGAAYMKRGQYEIALGKLKQAVAEDPGYAAGQTVLALLYDRIGEKDLAAAHHRKALAADPRDGDANNNYAVFLCQSGKTKEAQVHFKTALEDPFYRSPAVALTNAGSCAMEAGQLAEADAYLRRALKYNAEFPDTLITMVRLNFREKNFLKARAFMQRYEAVAEARPDSLLLGLQIESELNDNRAVQRYQSALNEKFPDSDEAAEARKILQK